MVHGHLIVPSHLPQKEIPYFTNTKQQEDQIDKQITNRPNYTNNPENYTMLQSVLRRTIQKLPVRGMATLLHPHQAAAASSLWIPVIGTVATVTVIAFAPPTEFDNLDCQSHCQQHCTAGVCE